MLEKRLEQVKANLPQLSLAERERRWRGIRTEMTLRELDCLLLWNNDDLFGLASANFRYVTSLRGSGVALFPREGEPIVWTGLSSITSAYLKGVQSWLQDIRPGAKADDIALALEERGWEWGNIGIVGFGSMNSRMASELVPYRPFVRLQEALPEANFSNESALLERLRMIKSPEEVVLLEKAAELAYLMFQALVETAKPGARECELVANMTQACLANGGEPSMILLDSGNPPLLHGRTPPYSMRRLEKGDIIITEFHSNYGGYQIGIEHSISLGKPRKEYRDIHRVCEKCFQQGVAALRPGTPLEQVERAFRTPAEEAGMTHIELGIHGHGLSSPEFPTFVFGGKGGLVQGHGLGKLAPINLEENMVFGTNIDINNPGWSKESGLMLGDTILVTRDGPRKLSRVPVEFTVV